MLLDHLQLRLIRVHVEIGFNLVNSLVHALLILSVAPRLLLISALLEVHVVISIWTLLLLILALLDIHVVVCTWTLMILISISTLVILEALLVVVVNWWKIHALI